MRVPALLWFAVLVFFFVSAGHVLFAQDTPLPPALTMGEDELQDKTKEISRTLRCAVCQSESVWESNATLAIQMRDIVRERLLEGQSADEIRAYFVSRYGDYIVFKPRFRGVNLLLWGGPFFILLLGGGILLRNLRKWTKKPRFEVQDAPAGILEPINEKQRQRIDQELRKS